MTKLIDWRPVFENEVVTTKVEVINIERNRFNRKKLYKTVLKVGIIGTLTFFTGLPIPFESVAAAAELAEAAVKEGGTWDKLVNGIIGLLDPLAKVFGVIAGIAIMTGNGKIGLERLFWLSVGYLTARKVGDWIEFLNNL